MLDARQEGETVILSIKDPESPVQLLQQIDIRIESEIEESNNKDFNQVQLLPQIEKRTMGMMLDHLGQKRGRVTIESNGHQIIKDANGKMIKIENPDLIISYKNLEVIAQVYRSKLQVARHRFEMKEKEVSDNYGRMYEFKKIESENAINIKNAENQAEIERTKNNYCHELNMLKLAHKGEIEDMRNQLAIYENQLSNEYERERNNINRDIELQRNQYTNDASKMREKNMKAQKDMINQVNQTKLVLRQNIANYKLSEQQEINRTRIDISKLKQEYELRQIQARNQREIDNT
eukprot:CAMPEP_0202952798 /NCGR_PEP_ID=MMETSP1395-20130829/41061_1 /ASSEMBLY_ACC=CAM_ASM_000871 /TAXON_ID=5961 /ORGANISM="Blepharisma japonicum, Strain Stock R1072" /LENGTH=291 /DNA_ID=CAMNT_0049664201 /DNA_START=396 /DNA_END=1268 /DNA_ORIENTATION=-